MTINEAVLFEAQHRTGTGDQLTRALAAGADFYPAVQWPKAQQPKQAGWPQPSQPPEHDVSWQLVDKNAKPGLVNIQGTGWGEGGWGEGPWGGFPWGG